MRSAGITILFVDSKVLWDLMCSAGITILFVDSQVLWDSMKSTRITILFVNSQVLWDLMCSAGTTSTASVLLDICFKDDMRNVHYKPCMDAITAIGVFAPPSEMVITKLIVS